MPFSAGPFVDADPAGKTTTVALPEHQGLPANYAELDDHPATPTRHHRLPRPQRRTHVPCRRGPGRHPRQPNRHSHRHRGRLEQAHRTRLAGVRRRAAVTRRSAPLVVRGRRGSQQVDPVTVAAMAERNYVRTGTGRPAFGFVWTPDAARPRGRSTLGYTAPVYRYGIVPRRDCLVCVVDPVRGERTARL